jgi:hypothetical protein
MGVSFFAKNISRWEAHVLELCLGEDTICIHTSIPIISFTPHLMDSIQQSEILIYSLTSGTELMMIQTSTVKEKSEHGFHL